MLNDAQRIFDLSISSKIFSLINDVLMESLSNFNNVESFAATAIPDIRIILVRSPNAVSIFEFFVERVQINVYYAWNCVVFLGISHQIE